MANYNYRKLLCAQCGRKILVESGVNGVDHTMWLTAACCLPPTFDSEYIKDHTLALADIKEWFANG